MANPEKSFKPVKHTDLLIALARAAGIQTRQMVGVDFCSKCNLELPPSLEGKILHPG